MTHIVESGRPDGPPVVFCGGLGAAWFDWDPVLPGLADSFRLIRYDRPGLGASPRTATVPSLRTAVRDLVELIAPLATPAVLVAHSMAAFHAEALARVRPDLVRAVVLVDPSWEPRAAAPVRLTAVLAPGYRLLGTALEATRLARLFGPPGRSLAIRVTSRTGEQAPPAAVREVYGSGHVLAEVLVENQSYREQAADLVALRSRRPFPAVPLTVLTAAATRTAPDPGQAELATMSPHGRQVLVPGARHMLMFDAPAAVATAVRETRQDW